MTQLMVTKKERYCINQDIMGKEDSMTIPFTSTNVGITFSSCTCSLLFTCKLNVLGGTS